MNTVDKLPETAEHTLRIAGMSCAACQSHVQHALTDIPGVPHATVDLLGHTAHVTAATSVDTQRLTEAVRRAGYDVLPASIALPPGSVPDTASTAAASDLNDSTHRALGLRALLALLAGALAMLLSMPLMSAPVQPGGGLHSDLLTAATMRLTMPLLPSWLLHTSANPLRWTLLLLASATMLFAAPEIYSAAWRAARHRSTNMNTLVALGTLVAFAASAYTTLTLSIGKPSKNFSDVYFESVVFILAFLLAGRWLETRARHRANASLRSFAHTETGNARWIAEGSPATLAVDPETLLRAPETLLPLDALSVGDLLRVLPGDRIPLDGIILAGRSSVDESMLTGEPLPTTRSRGDKLFCGTSNLDGPLLLRATALGADSMQAQMARLLERARSTRAPLQRLADRVSAVFVPAVLALAAFTFCIWALVDNIGQTHLGFGRALSLAIAVLVVACPCAMGLAVPAAMAVALGTAARAGILIKGGAALERLATVDAIAFDKTGTLTEGKPHIAAFVLAPKALYTRSLLLRWADTVEAISTHPLAVAVRQFAATEPLAAPVASQTDAVIRPGLGTEAVLDGNQVALGNLAFFQATHGDQPGSAPANLRHATPMHLVVNGQYQATFYAEDTPRADAATSVQALKQLGLRPVMLTGDTLEAAEDLGAKVDIHELRASLLPADKLTAITDLQTQGHRVAMVGDGLNDAAALAHADAGIAMASGNDLAREAGHVLLLHQELALIPRAIRLSRRTRRLMHQNLAWALLYNVLGIPLAAGILLPRFGLTLSPALASAAMALSSVSVLLNSLRLAKHLRT